jgi:TPR repeat protein
MKFFHPIFRMILICAVVPVALASANDSARLTKEQTDSLFIKVTLGDKPALETLTAEAQKGNKYAQYRLGGLYYSGGKLGQHDFSNNVIAKDYNQAKRWFQKAAEQGHADSQSNLGILYVNGRGVPQNYVQAAQWFRKAAAQGDDTAQYNLGVLYHYGQGVPQDYAQAAQWYRKAAAQGNADAQNNLGILHYNGQGVPANKVVAYALYSRSAAQNSSGDNDASVNRSELAEEMTKREIGAGETLSREMRDSGNFLKAMDEYLATPADAKEGLPSMSTSAAPESDAMLFPAAMAVGLKNVCSKINPSQAKHYSEAFERLNNSDEFTAEEQAAFKKAMSHPNFNAVVQEAEQILEQKGSVKISQRCASEFP